MSWAEIKHALNSTLGTDNFKPLDQILARVAYIGSNEITETLLDSQVSRRAGVSSTVIGNFLADFDGTINVSCTMYNGNSTVSAGLFVVNYSESSEQDQLDTDSLLTLVTDETSYTTVSGNLSVKKGETYYFHLCNRSGTSKTLYCNSLTLGYGLGLVNNIIKSRQFGSKTGTGETDITIDSVNINNCILIVDGTAKGVIKNGTTITISDAECNWQLIEFY